jgi:twitching motility two-component system response regulator PilH
MAKIPLVLHVDDSKMILAVVKDIIAYDLKLNLLQASDGHECIKLAKDNKPDIIFIDAIMEPMDGWKTAQELKKNPKTKDIPIVMVTGESKSEDIEFAYSIGVSDYIVKPPTKEKMLRKMVKLLGEQPFKEMGTDLSCCGLQSSAAAQATAQPAAAAAAAATQVPPPDPHYCFTCRGFLTWVPGSGWYCYICQKYADPQPPAPNSTNTCTCGKEMTYLFDQNRWYCYTCQK